MYNKDEPSATIRQFFEFSEPSTSLLKKEKNSFRTWTIQPQVGNLVPRASPRSHGNEVDLLGPVRIATRFSPSMTANEESRTPSTPRTIKDRPVSKLALFFIGSFLTSFMDRWKIFPENVV